MKFKILLLFIFIGITGCDQLNKATADKSNKEIEKRVSALEDKIHFTFEANEKLISDMAKMNLKLSAIEHTLENNEKLVSEIIDDMGKGLVAEFKKNSKGYMLLKTDLGNFPIVLKEINKSPDGYRFTFLLGNPYSFIINDFELIAAWGIKKPLFKDKTFTIIKDILPAVWTEVSIDLPASEDSEVQEVRLYFYPKTIKFDGDYRKMAQNLEMLKLLQTIK